MKTSPSVEEIRKWLTSKNPLGLFGGDFVLTDIDPKPWSGHFNYMVETQGKRFVLRFKGPEWGTTKGVADEYEIFKFVQPYHVAPAPIFFSEDFFGEPVLFGEFLDGTMLTNLPQPEQRGRFQDVASLIHRIGTIPYHSGAVPFYRDRTSYREDIEAWNVRVRYITNQLPSESIGRTLSELLPKYQKWFESKDDLLRKICARVGPTFIFDSAHIGHCMVVSDGYRFLNWEKVSFGDPTYTLAVFLYSIRNNPDVTEIKNEMVRVCAEGKDGIAFPELLEQRMVERTISNALYAIYAAVLQGTYSQKVGEDSVAKIEVLTIP